MTGGTKWTISLDLLRASDAAVAGGKAANLGEMLHAGLPAPKGFCITTAAFRQFLPASGTEALPAELADLPLAQAEKAQDAARRLRERLAGTPMPPEIEKAILAAWEEMWPDCAERALAVRSSATDEDLPGASFAGQQDSFLNVRGRDALIEKVRACWVSFFTDRAVLYRVKNRLAHGRAAMGVVVQELVPAEMAGVLFTMNPLGGTMDRVVIESVRGLGDALVSGRVAPGRLVIEKSSRRVLDRQGADCPDGETLRELLNLALRAEQLFGAPQDIEWAAAGGRVYLLQSRPVTALSPRTGFAARQVWTRANVGEVLPDVVTPLTWSLVTRFIRLLLRASVGRLGVDLERHEIVTRIAGRAYFNANLFVAVLRSVPGMGRTDLRDIFGGEQAVRPDGAMLRLTEADLPPMKISLWRFLLHMPGFTLWLVLRLTRRGDALVARYGREVDALRHADLRALTDEALMAHLKLRGTEEEQTDAIVVAGVGMAYFNRLRVFCGKAFPGGDGALANRLLAGVGAMDSAEAGLDLWRLAAFAHGHPDLEEAILASVPLDVLRRSAGGAEFAGRWDTFMARHGHHARGEIEMMNPRWAEQPEYVMDIVRSYLRDFGRTDPLAHYERCAAERERLTRECRARLHNPFKRALFNALLRHAQRGLAFRENLKSMMVRGIREARRAALELGGRFVQRGLLDGREDIFFLALDEILAVAKGEAITTLKQRVAHRRAEHIRNEKITPPAVVMGRFYAESYQPALPEASRLFKGMGVSAGVATGRARVILRADAAERVLPGEILVAPFTDPGWTPYFLPAAGIVMDLGGMLSHGSIVAREYGIPAVVNVGPATQVIRTGQWIRVDGNLGEVALLEEPS